MAGRFARSLVRRVRENRLGFLYALLAMSAEVVALWLLSTSGWSFWSSSDIDLNRMAVGQAVGMLGLTFLPAMLWSMPFRTPLNGTGGEDTVSSPDRSRVTRPSARVQRIAVSVWVVILVVALAQVAAALAGTRGVALPWGVVVGWLNLIAIIGGLAMQASAAGRQR